MGFYVCRVLCRAAWDISTTMHGASLMPVVQTLPRSTRGLRMKLKQSEA